MHLCERTQGTALTFAVAYLVVLSSAGPIKVRQSQQDPRKLLKGNVLGKMPFRQTVTRLGNSWRTLFAKTQADLMESCCQQDQHCCMRKVEECCLLGLPCCSTGIGYVNDMCDGDKGESCTTLDKLKHLCCIEGAWQPFCIAFQKASPGGNFHVRCEKDFQFGEDRTSHGEVKEADQVDMTASNSWESQSPEQKDDDNALSNGSGANEDDDNEDTNDDNDGDNYKNLRFFKTKSLKKIKNREGQRFGNFKDDIRFEDATFSKVNPPRDHPQIVTRLKENELLEKATKSVKENGSSILRDVLQKHPLKRRFSHEFEDEVDPETKSDDQPTYGWSFHHFNWGQGGK